MTNSEPPRHLTERDLQVLLALDRCPLTAMQILKISVTFPLPFHSSRSVHERLQKLRHAGWVQRWPYATASAGGSPHYYRLTPLGYQLLHGQAAEPPTKRHFSELALVQQRHTFYLAEFVVHTAVAAHRAGHRLARFYRENTLRLDVDGYLLLPDCAFEIHSPGSPQFNFLAELDNSTETVESPKDAQAWQRKILAYDRLQQRVHPHRFRVLILTTRSRERLTHILTAAARFVSNPQRRLFLGAYLPEYLAHEDALSQPCFRDHTGKGLLLVPPAPPTTPS